MLCCGKDSLHVYVQARLARMACQIGMVIAQCTNKSDWWKTCTVVQCVVANQEWVLCGIDQQLYNSLVLAADKSGLYEYDNTAHNISLSVVGFDVYNIVYDVCNDLPGCGGWCCDVML